MRQASIERQFAAALLAAGCGLMALAAIGCRRYPPPVPLDQLNAQQQAGHAVFAAHCAQCHYDRVDGGKAGPSLVSIFKKPTLHSGAAATDERVTATVIHGRGLMPPMGNVVDDQQLQDLLAYLHTL